MAEGNGFVLNNLKELLLKGDVDFEADTLKIALVSGWTPSVDGDVMWSSVQSFEASGAGYTAGGITLANKAVSQDDSDDEGVFDNTIDVTWAGLNVGTPGYAVLYKDTGSAATSPVLMYWELGSTPTNGGDYTLRFNIEGILNLT